MNGSIAMMTLVSLGFLLIPRTQAQSERGSSVKKNTGALTMTITMLDVTDTTLELSWEIRNDSTDDTWILAGLDKSDMSTSAFMDEDDRTLLIRRRLDLPAHPERASFPTCVGRYIRLRAGQGFAESVSLSIPVHCEPGIGIGGRKFRGLEHASRLSIEIGYYTGDMPGMIRRALEQDQKSPRVVPCVDPSYPNTITGWFRGLRGFNNLNELLCWRDEEVLIPYTSQAFTGEQVLHVTADDQHIPYEEKIDLGPGSDPPDLSSVTRVEIHYQPSMLEYFFPYSGQQSLLSPAEREYLNSMRMVVVENPDNLSALANDISEGEQYSGIVRQRAAAHVVCYRDGEHLLSFPIYNDTSIVTEERCRFEYANGLRMLRMLTPQVWPIELRVECAGNLKQLWNRFRLYEKVAKSGFFSRRITPYPAPSTWCVSMLRAYRITEKSDEYLIRPYKCPSAGYGECHYAMNPDCKHDSPGDTVLLFETKGGWDQHGGPELFTFDNHDPRGGCVLLNDGTVKFIRTTEELQQLRWK